MGARLRPMEVMGTRLLHDGYFTAGLENDPEVAGAIAAEYARQASEIELIASENLVSRAVLAAQGSILTNKTVEGLPGARYYGGAAYADRLESLAVERACRLFGARFADVQPHSGSNANAGVFQGLLKKGDTILAMDTAAGGHISHGHPATSTGRHYAIVRYGVDPQSELVDMAVVEELAQRHRPALLLTGGSAYPRRLDFDAFRRIADAVGAKLMVDMAHVAGLVATGLYPDPLPAADVVTTTTYKSLRGARGGLALWNEASLSARIHAGIFPGVQGSVMLHAVAGKAVCLGEALRPEFSAWNEAVLANARTLAQALSDGGLRLVSGGTDCGLMLVDLRPKGVTGQAASAALEAAGIACNKNQLPFDPQPAEIASGLRLSSNAGTTRGFGPREFEMIAGWVLDLVAAVARGDEGLPGRLRPEVAALCHRFPIYPLPHGDLEGVGT